MVADIQDDHTTAKEIGAQGGLATHVVMDVRERGEWTRLVDETERNLGPVNILANVAGVVNMFSPDNVVELTDEG